MNHRIRGLTILGLCALGLIYLNVSRPDPKYSLQGLHNSQVRWAGTYVGLVPFLSGKSDENAQTNDAEFIPGLIHCLDNEEQYAAAHVLLTQMAGGSYSISGGNWNGLNVQFIDSQIHHPGKLSARAQEALAAMAERSTKELVGVV